MLWFSQQKKILISVFVSGIPACFTSCHIEDNWYLAQLTFEQKIRSDYAAGRKAV